MIKEICKKNKVSQNDVQQIEDTLVSYENVNNLDINPDVLFSKFMKHFIGENK